MRSTLWLAVFGLLAACDSGDSTKSDTDTTGDTDIFTDEVSPAIVDGEVSIAAGSESSGCIWVVQIEADDPQGSGTLAALGSKLKVETAAGGEIFEEEMIVCDNSGQCSASFDSDDYGTVDTSQPDNYSFYASIADDDGNYSPYTELEYVELGLCSGDTGR